MSSLPDPSCSPAGEDAPAVTSGHRSGFVALVGRPNVGKSSLLNRLVGEKIAICSPVPQTTRHRIRGVITRAQGQLIILDTPGLSKPLDRLGHYLVEESQAALSEADVFLLVVDATEEPGKGDQWIAEQVRRQNKPVLLVLNKVDRLRDNGPLRDQRKRAYAALLKDVKQAAVLLVSAKTGRNTPPVVDHLLNWLPEGPRYYEPDAMTDQRLREMAAELIREQVLRATRDELPHSVAVQIDAFVEPAEADAPVAISATLLVNRESQKGMLIGKQGTLINRLRRESQRAIAQLMDRPATVTLRVKTQTNWRKDEMFLKSLGLAANLQYAGGTPSVDTDDDDPSLFCLPVEEGWHPDDDAEAIVDGAGPDGCPDAGQ